MGKLIKEEQVKKSLLKFDSTLDNVIRLYSKEKVINNQLNDDVSKLKNVIDTLTEGIDDDKRDLLGESMDLMEASLDKAEKYILEYSKSLKDSDVDKYLAKLNLGST